LPGAMPSYSPGGNRIFFSNSSAGGVWVVSSHGSDQGLFEISRNGWGSDWSTDGRMVYATSTAGGANLAVFNPVEGATDLLFDVAKTPYRQIFWNMAWSPDGKRVVFKAVTTAGKQEVGIIDARGEKFGFIRRFEGEILASFAWSPLENRILFIKQDPVTRHNQIYFVDPDSKDPPRLLPVLDELRNYSDIAYSPDGKRIVFSCSKRTSFE
ncbi:MAG: translocation protein TolB, partial [Planctomycetaceae bacterium]|nr:translocation protein TolB [Planctomycetaceae bacterium]